MICRRHANFRAFSWAPAENVTDLCHCKDAPCRKVRRRDSERPDSPGGRGSLHWQELPLAPVSCSLTGPVFLPSQIHMWTIHAAADAIRRRELTPTALLDECLLRIDQYEPHVRAWVLVGRDEAKAQAERLTQELKNGQHRGPLHGIPIGVKDIFDVFDWPTAAG